MTFQKEREDIMAEREDDGTPRQQQTQQEMHKQTNNAFEPRNSSPDVLASYAQQAQDERISKELFQRATTSQYRMETERYSFSKIIGRGGMGVVLRGYDKLLSRDVAVKFLNSELNENEEARKIFLTEARLMAKLAHPNLVAVYDVGSIEDKVMMVVELIEGNDLYQLLKESPRGLDQKLMLKVGIQLTEVVHYLHEQGMVHRDLKPANVMLKPDGSIKLIDFGLTRTMEVLAVRATSVRGTPAYMSPEQLAGEQITSTTDIYQIGATFFELLSGKLPFEMASYSPQLRREIPSLQQARPSLDPELCELITNCLAYKSEDRPQTAAEVSRRMQQILSRLTMQSFEPAALQLAHQDVDSETPPDQTSSQQLSAPSTSSHDESEQVKSRKLLLIGVVLLFAILGVGGIILAVQGGKGSSSAEKSVASAPDIAAASTLAPSKGEADAEEEDTASNPSPEVVEPAVEVAPKADAEAPQDAAAVKESEPTPPAQKPREAAPPTKSKPAPRKAASKPAPVRKAAVAPSKAASKPAEEVTKAEATPQKVPTNLEPAPAAKESSDQPLLFDKKSSNKKGSTTLLPSSGSTQDKPQLYQGN